MPAKRRAHTAPTGFKSKMHTRTLVRLLIFGFLLYAVIAGFSGLSLSLSALKSAEPGFIAAASLAVMLSYLCAAITYKLLSTKKIPFMPLFLVQISSGLVNRLLPAGLGGLGINMLFFKKSGYGLPDATAIVSINNALGLIGNLLLLLAVGLFFPVTLTPMAFPVIPWQIPAAVILSVVLIGIYLVRHHAAAQNLRVSLHKMVLYVARAAHRPGHLLGALLSSTTLTGLHAIAMFFVLQSVDAGAAWPVALIAISAGAFAGAALPTPGGLGGAEAGIVAALVAFSLPLPVAVATALIYRGITYWLPLLPGYLALRIVEKRYLY